MAKPYTRISHLHAPAPGKEGMKSYRVDPTVSLPRKINANKKGFGKAQ